MLRILPRSCGFMDFKKRFLKLPLVYMEANNESKMQKLDYIESNVCFFSQSQPAIIHCHIHIHINIITKPTSSVDVARLS